ncbi:MAG: hypothetical protein RLZZ458_367, partial [Planctomycetota bacterium]
MNEPVLPPEPADPVLHLQELARTVGISITPEQSSLLAGYLLRVRDWNQRLNLTRHTAWDV